MTSEDPNLPPGFTIALLPDVRRRKSGILVGGSPLRALRLAPRVWSELRSDQLTVDGANTALVARRLLDANVARPVLDDVPAAAASALTVVIPVRDRSAQLRAALSALGDAVSVVVVDDASVQPELVADVARDAGARLVMLTRNVGPAGARNAGLREVDTELVAFVDSDVQVSGEVLLELTRQFLDPQVVLVGPRIEGRTTSAAPRWFERYEAAASSLTLGRRPSVVRPGAVVGWLPSACLVGRKDALKDGFTETMRVGEDVDLVLRLVEEGHTVRYDPGLVAHHDTRSTVRSWLGRKFLYGTGGAEIARRHPDGIAPASLPPLMAAAALALMLRRRALFPVAGLAAVRSAHSLRRRLPEPDSPLAIGLAARGLGWALRQESALVLRHWWPLMILLAGHRTGRRVVASCLVVDSVVAVTDVRPRTFHDLCCVLIGRRLDDVSYGSGLWVGAIRARSTACLRIRIPRSPGR